MAWVRCILVRITVPLSDAKTSSRDELTLGLEQPSYLRPQFILQPPHQQASSQKSHACIFARINTVCSAVYMTLIAARASVTVSSKLLISAMLISSTFASMALHDSMINK